jgi:integrase
VYDDEVRGLCVAISPVGRKAYVLYRFVAGRPERVPIGLCSDLSVIQARKRAREMNTAIDRGQNPAADRRSVRDEMTLGELFETFLTLYAKEKKKTWRDDVSMFNVHLHHWRLRKISSLRRLDVITLHSHIGRTSGKYAANRVIELLSAMFNRARNDWGWEGTNPAERITPFKERSRKRFIEADELPRFFAALAEELNETIRDYILVSLLTGARRGNVESMEWKELDWRRATWTIPAEKAKADEDITVILVPAVTEILANRKASATGPFVFPGNGKTGHLVEPKTAWKRILKRAKLADLRLHDLRRSLGSFMAGAGASLPVIGKALGHESVEATKVYARLDLDPVRDAVRRATNAMLVAGGVAGLLEGGKS